MRLIIVSLTALLVAGCGSFGRLQERGATVADEGLDASVWAICDAATMGSIRRRFGVNADKAAAYELFCESERTTETVRIPIGGRSNATVE